MANEIDLDFGSLNLNDTNNIAISDIDFKERMTLKTHSIPQADSSIAETARRMSAIITVSGDVGGSNYDDLRTNIDALKAGLHNRSQKFTLDDDRYIMAQLQSFSHKFEWIRTLATWKAVLVANFPFWLAESASTDSRTPTSNVTYNLTNNGNAPARVKVRITNNDGGAIANDIAFTNTTNGDNFRFTGTVVDTKILEIDNRYDTDDFEVLNDGSDAHVSFEGDFLTLNPGVNVVRYNGSGTVGVVLDWRDTYY